MNSCVMNTGETTAAMLLMLATAPCNSPCDDGPACRDITLCTRGCRDAAQRADGERDVNHPALAGERVAEESDAHHQEADDDGASLAEQRHDLTR